MAVHVPYSLLERSRQRGGAEGKGSEKGGNARLQAAIQSAQAAGGEEGAEGGAGGVFGVIGKVMETYRYAVRLFDDASAFVFVSAGVVAVGQALMPQGAAGVC